MLTAPKLLTDSLLSKLLILTLVSLCGLTLTTRAAGEVDPSFDPVINDYVPNVSVITPQPDGKILIGGFFSSIQGETRLAIARLNPDGSLDTGFNANLVNTNPVVSAIALQPDGKI
jgi:hypothetical protein